MKLLQLFLYILSLVHIHCSHEYNTDIRSSSNRKPGPDIFLYLIPTNYTTNWDRVRGWPRPFIVHILMRKESFVESTTMDGTHGIYFRKDHSVLCWSQGRTLWMTTMESLIRVRRLYNKYNREHLLSLSVYKIVLFPGVKYLNSVRSQFSYSRSVHWEREEKEMYFIQFFLVVLLRSCLYCAIPEYIRAQPTRDMKGRPVPLRFVKQTYSN